MPKFEKTHIDFVGHTGKEVGNPGYIFREKLKEIAGSHHLHKLGSGSEFAVFALEGDSYAIAVSHNLELMTREAPFIAKKRYYVQKVLSTLFPHNFPRVYTSFGAHPDPKIKSISGSIRQRIEGKTPHTPTLSGGLVRVFENVITFLKVIARRQPAVRFPFKKVEDALEKMSMGSSFDKSSYNFILGDDGGEYYIDSPYSFPAMYPATVMWNRNKIIDYMEENGYVKGDITKVTNTLNRMESLDKEFKEKIE